MIKKRHVDGVIAKLEFEKKNRDKSKLYKLKTIYNSLVYIMESLEDHLSSLYYLVFQKDYLDRENT